MLRLLPTERALAARFLAALALALLLASPAAARDATYRVEIKAARSLKQALERDLDLMRWSEAEEPPDAELLTRLAQEAEVQAREILAASGYVSARVHSEVFTNETPMRVLLEVERGEVVRVREVELTFAGPIAESTDPLDAQALAEARAEFGLRDGMIFTQERWLAAKQRVLDRVARRRWPAATIAASEVRIDPERSRAEIALAIDSGPSFAFGDLEITGLARYSPRRVETLRPYDLGEIYDRERLDRFQRRLASTGYFSSVHVALDARPEGADAAPVRIAVIEAPANRIELGVGYGTDVKAYGSAELRNHDFAGRGLRLRTRVEADFLEQDAESELSLPERFGWSDTVGIRFEHTDIEDLDTQELSLVAKTSALNELSRPAYSVTFALSRQHAAGVLSESVYALLFEYTHTWRDTDDLLKPRAGWMAQLQLGAAPPGVSTRAFGRAIARSAYYVPLTPHDDLTLRAEAGAVLAKGPSGIPQSMLFRTGGSTTVRGYDFESLGDSESGAVLGGRYFALSSVEVTHWFNERIGAALFVDAGNAWNETSGFPLSPGYGTGLRAQSPIGPLRIDVAYGQDDGTVRVHFSLGLTF
ncbi:MAG TPA: BamA/TamA family outer membrane protein [Myxococcota bacterium]